MFILHYFIFFLCLYIIIMFYYIYFLPPSSPIIFKFILILIVLIIHILFFMYIILIIINIKEDVLDGCAAAEIQSPGHWTGDNSSKDCPKVPKNTRKCSKMENKTSHFLGQNGVNIKSILQDFPGNFKKFWAKNFLKWALQKKKNKILEIFARMDKTPKIYF